MKMRRVLALVMTVLMVIGMMPAVAAYPDKPGGDSKPPITSSDYPLYIGILIPDTTDGTIDWPNEPCVSSKTYRYVYSDKGSLILGEKTNSDIEDWKKCFASDASQYIVPTSDNFATTYGAKRGADDTLGVYNQRGIETSKLFKNNLLDENMKTSIIDAYLKKQNLTSEDASEYQLIPYVLKFEKSGEWHLDCVVLPNPSVTLTYDANLPEGAALPTGVGLPENQTAKGGSATITVSNMQYKESYADAKPVEVTVGNDTYTFAGWSNEKNATRPTYAVRDLGKDTTKIEIKANTTLYAVWTKNTSAAQPQYIKVKVHTQSAEKVYDGTALTKPELVDTGIDATLVYSNGTKKALKVALGGDKDSIYYADLYLGNDEATNADHDCYAILMLTVTGSQTEVGESKNTYKVEENSQLNFGNKLTGLTKGDKTVYIEYDDSELGTLKVTKGYTVTFEVDSSIGWIMKGDKPTTDSSVKITKAMDEDIALGTDVSAFPGDETKYKFVGWYDKTADKDVVDNTINKDYNEHTLVAKFEEITPIQDQKTITVNFNPAGGTFADGTTEVMYFDLKSDSENATENTLYIPDAPQRAGYDFVGWYVPDAKSMVDLYDEEAGPTRTYDQMNAVAICLGYGDELNPVINFVATYKLSDSSENMIKDWLGNITVECVTTDSGHVAKSYDTSVGGYTAITKEDGNGNYTYTITVEAAKYIAKYNEETGKTHTLADGEEPTKTIVISFKNYDKDTIKVESGDHPVTFKVVCENSTPEPELDHLYIDVTTGSAQKPYDGTALTKNEVTSVSAYVKKSDNTTEYLTDINLHKDETSGKWYASIGGVSLCIDVTGTLVGSASKTESTENTFDYNFAIPMSISFNDITDLISNNKYTVNGHLGELKVTATETEPDAPTFIVFFPTLEISNKVIAPKNFEKTTFEYDIINVKTGKVENSVKLGLGADDSSVRVNVTGGTEYQVVPKNLDVPGYIVATKVDPENGVITSDKIGNVTVNFTHLYTVGLNTEDHFAYIRGYEDGTVRPEGNITRAEVATIFYRLLSSEALEAFKTTENTFTDVNSDDWFNLAVSTLAKAGIISGYPDGSFNPNGQITRAELVAIASRFFTTIDVGDSKFEDIAGHWAAKEINEAFINGIINGYDDGTFKPDQAVTRAEAMKIVNGILGRTTDTCELIDGVKLWPDVAPDAWYYYIVADATNSHKYEATAPEKWTEIIVDEIEY